MSVCAAEGQVLMGRDRSLSCRRHAVLVTRCSLISPPRRPAATGKSSSRRRLSHTGADDIEKVARASVGGVPSRRHLFLPGLRSRRAMRLHGPVSTLSNPPPPAPPLCQLSSSSLAWKLSSAGPVMYSKLHLQPTDKSTLCRASRKLVRMKIRRDVLPCQAA